MTAAFSGRHPAAGGARARPRGYSVPGSAGHAATSLGRVSEAIWCLRCAIISASMTVYPIR